MIQALWKVFVEEDATLVEVNPLARLERRQARGARRQGLARRQRRVPAPGPRGVRDQGRDRPARGEGQGRRASTTSSSTARSGSSATAPGLVMSTLDVVAYAGEAHGGVKPANFLDIGGGANAQVMADGLDVILHDEQVKTRVRERLRRHHRLRRGRQRHQGRAGDPRRRGDQAARRPPRRQQRRRGPPDPRRAQPPAGHPGRHDGRRGRQGRRARRTPDAATKTREQRCRST